MTLGVGGTTVIQDVFIWEHFPSVFLALLSTGWPAQASLEILIFSLELFKNTVTSDLGFLFVLVFLSSGGCAGAHCCHCFFDN